METSSSSSVKGQSFFPWFSLLLTLKVPGREIFLLAAVVEILNLPEVPEVDGADLGCLCTGLAVGVETEAGRGARPGRGCSCTCCLMPSTLLDMVRGGS